MDEEKTTLGVEETAENGTAQEIPELTVEALNDALNALKKQYDDVCSERDTYRDRLNGFSSAFAEHFYNGNITDPKPKEEVKPIELWK